MLVIPAALLLSCGAKPPDTGGEFAALPAMAYGSSTTRSLNGPIQVDPGRFRPEHSSNIEFATSIRPFLLQNTAMITFAVETAHQPSQQDQAFASASQTGWVITPICRIPAPQPPKC
jgi:hypothetical protein